MYVCLSFVVIKLKKFLLTSVWMNSYMTMLIDTLLLSISNSEKSWA